MKTRLLTVCSFALLALTATLATAGGPNGRTVDTVRAYSSDSYTLTFRGDERATVIVSGDGDTDLDLFVYDANGNLVASDDDFTDDCVASWVPRWTGQFRIVIRNRGEVFNTYRMLTN